VFLNWPLKNIELKKRILYVEDEPFLAKIVKEGLEDRGYDVMHISDGAKVIESFGSFSPDICILDVMLPYVDGFSLGLQIRRLQPLLPIIFLTAKTQTQDLVSGFASGGTDYIKKPFSMEELEVRIQNQFQLKGLSARRLRLEAENKIGSFVFWPDKYELITPDKSIITLSHRESQVLSVFCSSQNQIISRRGLLLQVWGDDSFFNSRTLDVYIRKLRAHFSSQPEILIITLKGEGYHFQVPR
jgi:DNA-binding response OmpR family regulator